MEVLKAKTLFFLSLIFLFSNQFSMAYDPYQTLPIDEFYQRNYPPYIAGKEPLTCKINRLHLKNVKEGFGSTDTHVYEFIEHDRRKFIVFEATGGKYNKKVEVKIVDHKSKRTIISEVIADRSYTGLSVSVYWSYLNKDNKKDLILAFPIPSSSNDSYYVVFLLSNKKTYSVSRIGTMGISQSLFYDYNNDNKCEFLQLEVISGYELGKPTYLVYNILQFTSTSFKYNNKLSRFFPRWIEFKTDPTQTSKHQLDQYGHLPNDQPADLSQKTKDKLWSIHLKKF